MENLAVLRKIALIFDLDGTLIDSTKQIGYALNRTRVEFGKQELSSLVIEELIGLPIKHFLSDLELSKTEQEDLILRFREILEEEILVKNIVFPGAADFLIEMNRRGHKLGIATSKPTYLAELVIKNSSLRGLFDVIQGTEDFPPKPDPTCIQKAMMVLNTRNAIMVGDRTEDVYAANSAGISAVGIAHSFHDKQTLIAAGALYAFDSFLEFASSEELAELLIH